MRIENQEMLLYSMDKAINEAINAMKEEDGKEAYYRIGTAIHWIIDCMDRAFECINFENSDKEYRQALHAANNALKHRCDLITLHNQTHGVKFPFKLPFRLGLHYDWADIRSVEINSERQKKLYTEFLYDRYIDDTLKKAGGMVHFYFEKVKEDETERPQKS